MDKAASPSRRTFLKRGLFGGVVLLLGGAALGALPGAHVADPTGELLVLDNASFQVLVAIARRVIVQKDVDHVALVHKIDRSFANTAPEVQADIVKLLHLFDSALASALLDRRVVPFTARSGEDQDATLLEWRDSSLAVRRSGYHGLRKLCLVTYWAEESSFATVGYAPPAPGAFRAMAYPDSKWGDTT
jgi:hypothetical protein